MDFKVYKKEEVIQPSGTEYVYVPDVIDLIPVTDSEDNNVILNFETLADNQEEIEQMCGLATIWQRGLDPLALDEGVRWSEALLEEINLIQLMEDLTNAVNAVTPTVDIVFDIATDDNGQQYLKYTLQGVA